MSKFDWSKPKTWFPSSAKRTDSWQNFVTGAGTSRDKTHAAFYSRAAILRADELAALYTGDPIAARVVEFKPREMFRRGYEIKIGEDEKLGGALKDYAGELRADERLCEGLTWARLFGGAVVIVGADDGQDPSLQLNEAHIKTIHYLNVIDRNFLQVDSTYSDLLQPNFGKPQVYRITGNGTADSKVHESRVIRFDGLPADPRTALQLQGWGFSCLQRVYESIRQMGQAWQSVTNLMADGSQAVFKIQDFFEMASSGDSAAARARLMSLDYHRSTMQAIVLDAENEDFTRTSINVTGIPDMLDRYMQHVASAAEMPVTILFGQSPAGMNATGDSDFRAFYDNVASEQEKTLKPALMRLYKLICLASDGPAVGKNTEDLDVEFCPLWEMSDKEKADLDNTKATMYKTHIDAGVLLPEEVTLIEFGESDIVDLEARKRSLKAESRFETAINPPPPPQPPQGSNDPNGEPPANPPQVQDTWYEDAKDPYVVVHFGPDGSKNITEHKTKKAAIEHELSLKSQGVKAAAVKKSLAHAFRSQQEKDAENAEYYQHYTRLAHETENAVIRNSVNADNYKGGGVKSAAKQSYEKSGLYSDAAKYAETAAEYHEKAAEHAPTEELAKDHKQTAHELRQEAKGLKQASDRHHANAQIDHFEPGPRLAEEKSGGGGGFNDADHPRDAHGKFTNK